MDAAGADDTARELVGFLFDLTVSHPELRLRAGKGIHPTFMADLVGIKPNSYLYNVAPATKLVYFVPDSVNDLSKRSDSKWFTRLLGEALGPGLRDPGMGYYFDIYMSDLAMRKREFSRLVDETTRQLQRVH